MFEINTLHLWWIIVHHNFEDKFGLDIPDQRWVWPWYSRSEMSTASFTGDICVCRDGGGFGYGCEIVLIASHNRGGRCTPVLYPRGLHRGEFYRVLPDGTGWLPPCHGHQLAGRPPIPLARTLELCPPTREDLLESEPEVLVKEGVHAGVDKAVGVP